MKILRALLACAPLVTSWLSHPASSWAHRQASEASSAQAG